MTKVYFRVLGPIEVRINGRPIVIGSARQRVVLAMLLMSANHVVTVDKLIDAVWGEAPPPSARGQIQICISALRRALGRPELIDTSPTGYAIRVTRDQLDHLVFNDALARGRAEAAEGRLTEALHHLDHAVGLWNGAALADVPGRAAEAVAHRLGERRIMAIEDRIEIQLGLGAHRELVDELVVLTTEHPLRERLWGFLMLALYRSGRQAEALSAYRSARKSIVEELGIEPGEQLRHLERAILAHDNSLHVAGDAGRTPAEPARQVPQQLPADLPDFVGREPLVADLDRALTGAADQVPIAVVTGAPGCGKTTLAVHVAHLVRERFPDGILFGSVHGSTAQPRSTGALLGDFLRALGVSADAVPDNLDERIKLVRSRMAERRLLVVLDDVAAEEQVTGLLPGVAGPAVLITSRNRLAGLPGARAVEIEMMSVAESFELLGKICGLDRVAASAEATGDLTRICGGLPLALRIAGVRLSAHPHWSVRTLVDRLSDERYRLDELAHGEVGVRSLLAEVYESLTEPAQRLLRLLSELEMHEFATWNAAALLDGHLDRAGMLLDELADARLLEAGSSAVTGEPRYRLHGLVRVFAHELRLAQDDEAAAGQAVLRVLGGLLAFAEEAHLRLYGGNYTALRGRAPRWAGASHWFDRFLADPMAWFDEERGSLEAAVRQAAELEQDELCWELATAAVTVYEARGLFGEWRATHRRALEATRRAGNRRGQAAVLASLGSLGVAQHSEHDADILDSAMRLFEEVGDDAGIGLTLRNLAHLDRIQGRPEAAVRRYEQALEKFRDVGDHGARAHLLSGLARSHLDLGAVDRAEALAKESLALGEQLGNRRLQAQALHRLGEVFADSGQTLAAKAVFQEALDLARELRDQVGQSYALNGLGAAMLEQDELNAAEIHFAEAVEICRTTKERNALAHAVFGLGQVYAKRGEHDHAEHYFVQAANEFAAQENNPWHTRALDALGAVRRAASRLSVRPIDLG